MRNLILAVGDQLDHASAAFDGFDSEHDVVWMADVEEETTQVCTPLFCVWPIISWETFGAICSSAALSPGKRSDQFA